MWSWIQTQSKHRHEFVSACSSKACKSLTGNKSQQESLKTNDSIFFKKSDDYPFVLPRKLRAILDKLVCCSGFTISADFSSELSTVATVLDPRLKLQFYMSDKTSSAENPEEIRLYVESFYENDYANQKSNSNASSPAKKPGPYVFGPCCPNSSTFFIMYLCWLMEAYPSLLSIWSHLAWACLFFSYPCRPRRNDLSSRSYNRLELMHKWTFQQTRTVTNQNETWSTAIEWFF